MRVCTDCGRDAGRGWTNPSDHAQCAPCATERALRMPVPDRNAPPTYWQLHYQRRKARLWEEARRG